MIIKLSKINVSQKLNHKLRFKSGAGFTLVEIMVAMTIFVTVMTLMAGSIFSVINANQKSKNLRSSMDNLNLTMESMTRTIRFGTNYHSWGCSASADISVPHDCNTGLITDPLTVKAVDDTQVTYSLSGGRIVRTISGTPYFLTSSDVTITTLAFRVYGSSAYPDLLQPQVIIVVQGNVGSKASTKSTFGLETTVSQRVFDFQ